MYQFHYKYIIAYHFISKAVLNLGIGTEKKKSRTNLCLRMGAARHIYQTLKVKC